MTVSSAVNKVIGAGNGVTTVWPFSFKVFDVTHLVVVYTDAAGADTTLASSAYVAALNADQNNNPGGTVTYTPAIATGTELTILRTVPYTQAADIENQGAFYPSVLERAYDLLAMQVQQVVEIVARCLKLSPSQAAIDDLEATDANRASTFLGFDAAGALGLFTGLASTAVSLAMQPVIAAASLVAARTAMGVPGLGANTFTGAQTLPGNAASALQAVPLQQIAVVPRVQGFTATGTYTPHANMIYCIMECIGGGGGGGGTATAGAATGSGGGGGGAGSYSRTVALRAAIGASKAVTIGAAGAAGTAGNNAGGAGGDTSVGALCIGKGGAGGGGSAGSGLGGASGAGGVAGTGDVTSVGAPGGATTSVSGTACVSGRGADGQLGGGAPGVATATTTAGAAAAGKGGGGSGGSSFNAGGTAAGGLGGAGVVIVTEFCSA